MMVSTTHPRIWLSPPILARLKAQAAVSDSRWLALKQAADAPADWSNGLLNVALAYAVTGDASYAQKALSLLLPSCADGLNAITPDSGYQARNALPAVACCFDWLYPVLTPAQKTTLVSTAELWADWVFPRTNPIRAGAWGVSQPGNNYHAGFLTTWMVGLALSGDSAKAQGYIDEARSRWQTLVMPYLANEAKGGLWAEGVSYGTATTGFYLYSLLAHQTSTGEDFISNPWFTDMVSGMLHLTNPPMTELAPFGDIGAGPINDNHRRAMLLMAPRDSRCKAWLDGTTPNKMTQRLNAHLEFLLYPAMPVLAAGQKAAG